MTAECISTIATDESIFVSKDSRQHSVDSLREADDCTARMMRNPNCAGQSSDAAPLLPYGIGLLVRHDLDRQGPPGGGIAFG